jgi:hypothetical protein
MMRRDFATDSCSSTTELRAIVIAGTLGSGAGLIADVITDVVKLSLGRVERRRKNGALGERAVAVERLDIDPLAVDRRRHETAGLAIVCDGDASDVFSAAELPADERIVVDDGVPAWRQDLLPADDRDGLARRRSIDVTARGVAIVSRRMPYDRQVWRRSLARHVPKRFRDAALARFDAETSE